MLQFDEMAGEVGADGRVAGIDISESMLALARERDAARATSRIRGCHGGCSANFARPASYRTCPTCCRFQPQPVHLPGNPRVTASPTPDYLVHYCI